MKRTRKEDNGTRSEVPVLFASLKRGTTNGRILAGLLLLMVALMIGCTVTRENYATLSKYFDGVPDPDKVKVTQTTASSGGDDVIAAAAMPIISRHKPYVDR